MKGSLLFWLSKGLTVDIWIRDDNPPRCFQKVNIMMTATVTGCADGLRYRLNYAMVWRWSSSQFKRPQWPLTTDHRPWMMSCCLVPGSSSDVARRCHALSCLLSIRHTHSYCLVDSQCHLSVPSFRLSSVECEVLGATLAQVPTALVADALTRLTCCN
jgi:hypothetical protein